MRRSYTLACNLFALLFLYLGLSRLAPLAKTQKQGETLAKFFLGGIPRHIYHTHDSSSLSPPTTQLNNLFSVQHQLPRPSPLTLRLQHISLISLKSSPRLSFASLLNFFLSPHINSVPSLSSILQSVSSTTRSHLQNRAPEHSGTSF